MKNTFIICNILFFLMGNILFPTIHHLHNHHDTQIEDECQECLIIDDNNYIFHFEETNVQLYKSNLFKYKNICILELDLNGKYLSRAPPIF